MEPRAIETRSPTPAVLPTKPNASREAWEPTFADEYVSSKLDGSKWNTQFWWGRTRDRELAYYTDDSVESSGGVLSIRADRLEMDGYRYVSGVVTTLGKFAQKYGFFEARSQMPAGKGLWPAIWLMPDAGDNRTVWPPEIDIVESLGDQTELAYMNVHYTTPNTPHGQYPKEYRGPELSAGFHIYGLEWAPNALIWYVDGIERHRVRRNIPETEMYLIINLAVGHWAGEPDAHTQFPASLLIDYVRVWQSGDADPMKE